MEALHARSGVRGDDSSTLPSVIGKGIGDGGPNGLKVVDGPGEGGTIAATSIVRLHPVILYGEKTGERELELSV